jgi:hypothetical protein
MGFRVEAVQSNINSQWTVVDRHGLPSDCCRAPPSAQPVPLTMASSTPELRNHDLTRSAGRVLEERISDKTEDC